MGEKASVTVETFFDSKPPGIPLEWKNSELSVFYAFNSKGLDFARSANTSHLQNTLKLVAEISELDRIPQSHDFRFGAAREIASLGANGEENAADQLLQALSLANTSALQR